MEISVKDKLYIDFMANGFKPYDDIHHTPHEHQAGAQLRSRFNDIDSRDFAYAMVITVFDLFKIPNYPRNQNRYIYEAHVRFYGNNMPGDEGIPSTAITYTVVSVKQATDHAYRMWQAMGRTTE